MSRSNTGTCVIPECEEPAKYATSGLCSACYQYARRWMLRGPTETAKRKNQVDKWSSRLTHVISTTPRRRRQS